MKVKTILLLAIIGIGGYFLIKKWRAAPAVAAPARAPGAISGSQEAQITRLVSSGLSLENAFRRVMGYYPGEPKYQYRPGAPLEIPLEVRRLFRE